MGKVHMNKVVMITLHTFVSLLQAPQPRHPVPSQSPRIPSPSVSPVAVNTLTHDMNKQGAPSRPAMAASPQQQEILPNQANPGAPPMMNMGQVRFQQAPRQALPRYQVKQPNDLEVSESDSVLKIYFYLSFNVKLYLIIGFNFNVWACKDDEIGFWVYEVNGGVKKHWINSS